MARSGSARPAAFLPAAVALAVAATALLLAVVGPGRTRAPASIVIATAAPGGAYASLGEGMAVLLRERFPGTHVEVRHTGGSVENLALLAEGQAELAFAQSDTERGADARLVAGLYEEVLHVVVNLESFERPPRTIQDLEGKVLAIGAMGSGTREVVSTLLGEYRVDTYEDAIHQNEIPTDAETWDWFRDGTIDAFLMISGIPNANVERLLEPGRRVLIGVDDPAGPEAHALDGVLRRLAGYHKTALIPGTYGPQQPSRVLETIGVTAQLVARADLDAAFVEELTRLLFDRRTALIDAHVVAKQLDQSRGPGDGSHPLHPGAASYYAGGGSNFWRGPVRGVAFGVAGLALLAAALLMRRTLRASRRARFVEEAAAAGHATDDDHDVFIAYRTESPGGVGIVQEIADVLEANGVRCWFAPRNIEGGANWSEAIPAAISSARRAFVLVLGEGADASDHVQNEVALASDAHLPILPYLTADVAPTGSVLYYTANVQRIQGFDVPREVSLGRLLQAVQRLPPRDVPGAPRVPAPDPGPEGAGPEGPETETALEAEARPRRGRRVAVLGVAAAVVLAAAVFAWAPWRGGSGTSAPRLLEPVAGAMEVGGLLTYRWSWARHSERVEYEVERWIGAGASRTERVTTTSWTENAADLVGEVRWRVRALHPGADGAFVPAAWSPVETFAYYADTLEKVRRTGRVVITMSRDQLNYRDDDDEPTNLELELARLALEEDLRAHGYEGGLRLDRAFYQWGPPLFSSLERPENDLMTASLTIKPEREKAWRIRFTQPVLEFPPVFVHWPGQDVRELLAQADGRCRIGVKRYTTHEALANLLAERNSGVVKVVPYERESAYLHMYEQLVGGKVEVLLYDEPFAVRVQQSAAAPPHERRLSLTPVDASVMDDPPMERIGIGTKPFDARLRKLLDEAVETHRDELEELKRTLKVRKVF